MSWNQAKGDYEDALDFAAVYDLSSRRAILKFMRTITTLQNRLRTGGYSWNRVSSSVEFERAWEEGREIGYDYPDEWFAFTEALGLYPSREPDIDSLLA